MNVTGTTLPTSAVVTLTDLAYDTIQLTGNVEGSVIRGSWFYASGGIGGSFRMAAEEIVHLLDHPAGGANTSAVRAALFE